MRNPFESTLIELPELCLQYTERDVFALATENLERAATTIHNFEEYRTAFEHEIQIADVTGHIKFLMPGIDLFLRLKDTLPLQVLQGPGMGSALLYQLGLHPFNPMDYGFLLDPFFSAERVHTPHLTLSCPWNRRVEVIEVMQAIVPPRKLLWAAHPGQSSEPPIHLVITGKEAHELPFRTFREEETGLTGISVSGNELERYGFLGLTIHPDSVLTRALHLAEGEDGSDFLGSAASFECHWRRTMIESEATKSTAPEWAMEHRLRAIALSSFMAQKLDYLAPSIPAQIFEEDWVRELARATKCSHAKALLFLAALRKRVDPLVRQMTEELIGLGASEGFIQSCLQSFGLLCSRRELVSHLFREEWSAALKVAERRPPPGREEKAK